MSHQLRDEEMSHPNPQITRTRICKKKVSIVASERVRQVTTDESDSQPRTKTTNAYQETGEEEEEEEEEEVYVIYI